MATSFVYRNAHVYELVMRLLYGRHYWDRYRAVAELIPAGASVLDVCCGPGTIYERFLRDKSVAYRGLDINPRFVQRLQRRGVVADVWDARQDRPLPIAEYVLLQASLYHFLPHANRLVDRMWQAATRQVIIAEPVRNLATSSSP